MPWRDQTDEEDDDHDHTHPSDDLDEEPDSETLVHNIEAAFRVDRAALRSMTDPEALREERDALLRFAGDPDLHVAARLRARDLVEIIDDRLTDLEARRTLERSR